eukprot:scaffold11296_cov23-Tisochrysis_lutea.AAC.1
MEAYICTSGLSDACKPPHPHRLHAWCLSCRWARLLRPQLREGLCCRRRQRAWAVAGSAALSLETCQ